jgi:hypothetical protein
MRSKYHLSIERDKNTLLLLKVKKKKSLFVQGFCVLIYLFAQQNDIGIFKSSKLLTLRGVLLSFAYFFYIDK